VSNQSPCRASDLPCAAGRGRLSPRPRACRVTAFTLTLVTAAFAVVVLIALGLAWRTSRRGQHHQRAYTRVLDAADALESRLRTARTEIEAITGHEDDTVRTALQEILRQRLWLKEHGADASVQKLDGIRASLDQARERIDQQLELMERARSAAL